jgi:hypothetical protein
MEGGGIREETRYTDIPGLIQGEIISAVVPWAARTKQPPKFAETAVMAKKNISPASRF